jgi:hypothetical protein
VGSLLICLDWDDCRIVFLLTALAALESRIYIDTVCISAHEVSKEDVGIVKDRLLIGKKAMRCCNVGSPRVLPS